MNLGGSNFSIAAGERQSIVTQLSSDCSDWARGVAGAWRTVKGDC